MKDIRRDIEDLERFEEIVRILSSDGFGFILSKINVLERTGITSSKDIPGPEQLRETIERLGPTFIKFGQILAQRPDILPKSYIEELQRLEDDVPEFDSDIAMHIIEEEIDIEKFEYVQEKPIAAASIAQVHRARLKTGEEVIIKVRRPGIGEKIREDLDILEFMAKKAEKEIGKLRELKAHNMVEEFASWTRDELNLRKEAKNAQRLKRNLSDEDRVKVPEVFLEHTTEKVLTMEYVDGVKCNNKEKLQQMDIEAEDIARTAIRAGLKQVIRDGFFHADPHPSNFLIQEDGKLVYLDFGMMGKFSKSMQENLGLLFLHAANEDVDAATEIVKKMAVVEDDADLEKLKKDIEEKLLLVKDSSLEEHSISKELLDITIKAAERGVHMPTSFAIVGKSLVTMEGIGLTIYPQFKMTDEYEKIARQIIMEKNDPSQLVQNFVIDLIENKELVSRPFTQLKNFTAQHKKTLEKHQKTKTTQTLAAGLFISSALIIIETLPSILLTAIGLGQLVIATILLIKTVKN